MKHYDHIKCLYIDIDVFKVYKFGAVLYYIKEDFTELILIIKLNVKLIMFLNKGISVVELRYWPIKFEVIDIIWIICKVKYLVNSGKYTFIVYTDYVSVITIFL